MPKPSVRLIQGDCLEVMKSIPSGSVDLVLADPPYGTTQNKWDTVIHLESMWNLLKRAVHLKGAIVLTANEPFTSVLVCSNLRMFRYRWVWEKTVPTGHLNANKMPMKWCEDAVVFYSKLPRYNPILRRGKGYSVKLSDVHSSNYGSQKNVGLSTNDGSQYKPKDIIGPFKNVNGGGKLHPTQKPVELMEYMINTYTQEGETVLDFTMGSGTTGVAAKRLGRKFIGIEKDPDIFELAKQRIDSTKWKSNNG